MTSTRAYSPKQSSWPYTPQDFRRYDESVDTTFYDSPRLVTHIDDHAIAQLQRYYSTNLPARGKILDFCSSWISHLPEGMHDKAKAKEGLEVIGMGMNRRELDANEVLSHRIVQDLNDDPSIPDMGPLDAATCVVSIDYLTRPLEVLRSLKSRMNPGGRVHLVISNRCFPTKAIGRWLNISEEERLEMVGDYLHYGGWEEIEIVQLCNGWAEIESGSSARKIRVDPLWVVRGTAGGEA